MKHMNNHFGQRQIFYAPDTGKDVSGSAKPETDGKGSEDGNNGSQQDENGDTVEGLMAQLAAERAKSAKLQNEKDNASSEAANYKKQLRAKMTAQEKEAEAKAEAEAAKDAKIKELESKFRIMDYGKRFMGVGRESGIAMDETTAMEFAGMIGEIGDPDKFFSALDKFVKTIAKKAGDDRIEEITRRNPSIYAGNGDADKESEAVRLAKESAARRKNKGFNEDALKQWM